MLAPGVPLTHPAPHWSVGLARSAGVEVIGDIELFCRERRRLAPDSPFVAITGTNGKSTTTALIEHLLTSAGRAAELGGNIGTAILTLEPPRPDHAHVIECSSYQIDLAPSLDPRVGILINVSEDHLDRHGTLANYAAVKERLVAGVQADGAAMIGVDDDWCRAAADRIEQRRAATSSASRCASRCRMASTSKPATIMRAAGGDDAPIARLGGIGSLRGLHNAQNAACAAAAALALGLDAAAIQAGLRSFPGLAHRMEQVGRKGAVLFVNDSKATNADSVGAGAGLLQRHVLDRRRQAEDRRHHLARELLPAHPQGLSDRRGGGGVRRDARRQGRLRDRRHARSRGRGRRARRGSLRS